MHPEQSGALEGLGWGWVNDKWGLKRSVRVCMVRSHVAGSHRGVSSEGRRCWKAPRGVLEVCCRDVVGVGL